MLQKVLLGVVGVLALLAGGLAVGAAMQPDTTHVERSVVVSAAPADVFPFANNFDLWVTWNPWQEIDPKQVVTFSDNHEGKGAWYEWKGNNDVGHGKMTILESTPPTKVVDELHFMEPFESMATATLTFVPEGENTKVTWAFDGKNDFMAKAAGMFMDMDTMLGNDFQKGLDRLKPLAEAAAQKRLADEKAAAAALIVPEVVPVVDGPPGIPDPSTRSQP